MTLCGISSRFQLLSPTERQVPHALLTRSPLSRKPKLSAPFDLHVLGTPPAFVLSQDQTLKKLYLKLIEPQIKFLNNLLLAFITQEFSLAVFSLTLKQSIYCPRCFLFVFALFNLQGTGAVSRQLAYDTISRRVCQALFHKFRHDFLYAFIAHSCAFMADFFSPRPSGVLSSTDENRGTNCCLQYSARSKASLV